MPETRDVAVLKPADRITVHGWGYQVEATMYEQLGTYVRAIRRYGEAGAKKPLTVIVSTAAIANHLLAVETGWAANDDERCTHPQHLDRVPEPT